MKRTLRIVADIVGALLLATGIAVPAQTDPLHCGAPCPRDYSGDGYPDVMALDSHGTLWLYPGDGDGGFKPRIKSATGWHYTAIIPSRGAFYGVFARDKDGNLWAIPSNGHSGWRSRTPLGGGWNQMTSIIDESGRGNLLAIDRSGTLWRYPYTTVGNGYSVSWQPRQRAATGWAGRMLVDLHIGGGWPWFYARDTHGILWPYDDRQGIQVKTPTSYYTFGSGWNRYTRIVEAGDWENVDGLSDLIATDKHGDLWMIPGGDAGKHRVKIGHGFSGYTIW